MSKKMMFNDLCGQTEDAYLIFESWMDMEMENAAMR